VATKSLHNEQELLAKIADGDQNAFTVLFNHYQRDVFVHSKRLVHSEHDALEAVQDIFIKIWVGREKLRSIDNFGGYLNRIVRNYSFDLLKQLAREIETNLSLQKATTEIDYSTGQLLEYNQTIKLLNEVLDELSPQQKLVYKLCHQNGLTYEEAAVQLNISIETVRAHMKQALKKIREHFSKYAVFYPMLVIALCK